MWVIELMIGSTWENVAHDENGDSQTYRTRAEAREDLRDFKESLPVNMRGDRRRIARRPR